MVFGRLREAAADAAETLRRVFSDPGCQSVPLALAETAAQSIPSLEAVIQEPPYRFAPETALIPTTFPTPCQNPSLALKATLQEEAGWTQWASGAKVCIMPIFSPGATSRLSIPPVPRRVPVAQSRVGLPGTTVRGLSDPLPRPRTRSLIDSLARPRCFNGLQTALALPVGITAEDQSRIPRALWMRYSLQLVKATDENIRNLEMLGIFNIPTRGVQGLRHDATSGRLFLNLGAEAAGASRGRLMLARRKGDRSLVSCFLEEA